MGQSASPVCGSVWGGESMVRGQNLCLASGGLPVTHPLSSHFILFPYAIGTLPAAALGFADVLSPCRPFKQWKSSRFFCHPTHTVRGDGGLSSQWWNPWLFGLVCGWDGSLPAYTSQILITFHECGIVCSTTTTATATASPCHTASLPCVHDSAPPPCLGECGFFKSLVVRLPCSSIFWWFWVLHVFDLWL